MSMIGCITFVIMMSPKAAAGSIIICITPGSEVPQVGIWLAGLKKQNLKFPSPSYLICLRYVILICEACCLSSLVSQDWAAP